MIEINLVPDVKQELIKAQRVRTLVVTFSILIGLAVTAVVVLLSLWVFVGQGVLSANLDNDIKTRSAQLTKVEDISNTLTIQNQLNRISTLHDTKNIDSRIFDILATINPPAPNNIGITSVKIDSTTKVITIEAQATNQYTALEVFQKTINATNIRFTQDGESKTIPLASNLSDTERSIGENGDGARVLRFSLTFTYSDQLFSRLIQNAEIVAPNQKNATDSFLGVPNSLFTPKASDLEGGN